MKKRSFKPFGNISALTLGGGGLGQVWGETSREEAVETVNLAIEKGITHLDVAPMYGKGEAERVVGEVFKGKDLRKFDQVDLLKHFGKLGKPYVFQTTAPKYAWQYHVFEVSARASSPMVIAPYFFTLKMPPDAPREVSR